MLTDFEFKNAILKHNYEDWLLVNKATGEEFHIPFTDLTENCDFVEAGEFCNNYLKKLNTQ